LKLRSTLQSAGWCRKRALQDLVILTGSFLLFLWVAHEASLFGEWVDRELDPAKRIDFYEAFAAGALLVCGLWVFALRRASELRAEIRLRSDAETRAADADFRARHDPLTGLGNRAKFDDNLADLVTSANAGSGNAALLLLDLNGFKKVNDRFGHPYGDEVLRITAQRLRLVVRGDEDQLCRLGGDEFAIIINGLETPTLDAAAAASSVAEKIIHTIDAPIQIEGRASQVGVAIGIALCSASLSATALVAAADKALYAAKERSRLSGQSCYAVGSEAALPHDEMISSPSR
jgi:diguanylate cyclase (GGDEF)-like protein